MKCTNPIIIMNKKNLNKKGKIHNNKEWDTEEIVVPCRHCIICERMRSLEWTKRLLHEYETNGYIGRFITLTYEIEPNEGVSKKEFQKFLKRFRKNLKNRKIKYFACGEYGEIYGRAHYHAIILNIKIADNDILNKSWNMGITDSRPIQFGSAKYVVDYMHKDIPDEIIAGRNKCFTLKSKGIGLNWAKKYIQEIKENKCIIENGKKQSIPRYYLKKMRDNTIQNGEIIYQYLTEENPLKIKWEEQKKRLLDVTANKKIAHNKQREINAKKLKELK